MTTTLTTTMTTTMTTMTTIDDNYDNDDNDDGDDVDDEDSDDDGEDEVNDEDNTCRTLLMFVSLISPTATVTFVNTDDHRWGRRNSNEDADRQQDAARPRNLSYLDMTLLYGSSHRSLWIEAIIPSHNFTFADICQT